MFEMLCWLHDKTDEYGKNIVPNDSDVMQITSLTTKGYIRNHPSRYATKENMPGRTCEFTDKGKDVIKNIILHKEKSAFDKSSSRYLDYEAICRSAAIDKMKADGKIASQMSRRLNWFERSIANELTRWK